MLKSKDTPAQTRERLQWVVDAVRENQEEAALLLHNIVLGHLDTAKWAIADMKKMDRDALLLPGGILTDAQLELLK